MQKKLLQRLALTGATAVGLATAVTSLPTPAHACGGFFCSAANPVNQAAEQIVFSKNADGTVTAVIEIQYEGPSTHFAWLLPIAGTPKVEVSSAQAFTALRQVSDPQYNLQTVFEDGCAQSTSFGNTRTKGPAALGSAGSAAAGEDSSVRVEASGAIGPYDWEVISVKPDLPDVAQTAVDWLKANDYDVGPIGPDVLRPYLKDGINLLAIRLQKGASTGSIRPIMVTYESSVPAIPIRPTAVAANDDMGVLVWVLANSRAIPSNYKALELNEALINWFMPNTNYNDVVSRAADEAGGQGFVTEHAGKMSALTNQGSMIFPEYQQQTWDQFSGTVFSDSVQMIQQANENWGTWDGFDDALRAAATLPDTVTFDDFKLCARCYIGTAGVTFDNTVYLQKLFEFVIKPMLSTQQLLDSRPYMTRLYTTMSADEMTADPAFDFNADIADVSNIHTATRTIECPKGGDFGDPSAGPWHVELTQGGTVHGTGMAWPIAVDDQPAALKILEFGTKGQAKVVEDRTAKITEMLEKAQKVDSKAGGGTQPTGSGSGNAGTTASGTSGAGAYDAMSDDGCSVGQGQPANALSLLLLSFGALFSRRRRGA